MKENISSKISDIARSKILSDISPQARETKEKVNKWDYIKLKSFCTAKEIINKIKIKRQPTEWENILTDTSSKGLISKILKRIYKTQHTHTHTQKPNPIEKMVKGPE